MRRPTAAQRTISLFTGKTDIEDPLRGRDGTLPEELQRVSRGREYKWHVNGAGFSWAYGKQYQRSYIDRGWIEANRGEYHAWAGSQTAKPRVFDSLTKAAEWVEDSIARLK